MAAKVRNTALVLTAALLAASVLVPMAQAQSSTLDMTLNAPTSALIPESQIGQLKATVDYSGSVPLQGAAALGAQTLVVTFRPQCPSTVLVVGPQAKVMTVTPVEGTTPGLAGSTDADFQISITRDAPGLKSIQCSLTASAGQLFAAGVDAPEDVPQTFIVSADYYSLVQAKVATKIQQAGPQKEVPFSIELTNFGNARTQLSFEITNAPAGERWTAVVPDNIILDSPNGGGEGKTSDTAIFTVSTPYKNGWNNEQGAYQVTIRPTAADNPEKQGNPLAANILVRVRGVYVPSLEPIIMVGALVGSAFVLRNREEE